MKIQQALQTSYNELRDLQFNLIMCATGKEERGPYFAGNFSNTLNAELRIVFSYNDRPILKDEKNLAKFRSLGFKVIDSLGTSGETIKQNLREFILNKKGHLNILIDYSSMTKIWYGAIIDFFSKIHFDGTIDLYFTYTPALHEEIKHELPNQYVDFVPGFYSLSLPDEKTSLIIALGSEKIRAAGLIELLDLDFQDIFLFRTSGDYNFEISNSVFKNNLEVIRGVKEDNIFLYDLADVNTVVAVLASLCHRLISDRRVIIAPLGPKPFSLISMILAKELPEIGIIRVGAGEQGTPPIRRPDKSKPPIIFVLSMA